MPHTDTIFCPFKNYAIMYHVMKTLVLANWNGQNTVQNALTFLSDINVDQLFCQMLKKH